MAESVESGLWRELHTRALTYEDGSDDKLFIWHFANKIPRYIRGCACDEFFNKWRAEHPPVFSSRDAYFRWTWELHNAVNAKLGKPEHTLAAARAHWASQAAAKGAQPPA